MRPHIVHTGVENNRMMCVNHNTAEQEHKLPHVTYAEARDTRLSNGKQVSRTLNIPNELSFFLDHIPVISLLYTGLQCQDKGATVETISLGE